jgi:transposase
MLSCWYSDTKRVAAPPRRRARYERANRMSFAALARLIPGTRRSEVFPVTPATLLASYRKLAAKKYDTSRQRAPGRPSAVRRIARLVVRLAKENPLWEYRLIHGELTKLGVTVAQSTVWEILRVAGIDRHHAARVPTWRQFMHARPGRRDPRRGLLPRGHRAAVPVGKGWRSKRKRSRLPLRLPAQAWDFH